MSLKLGGRSRLESHVWERQPVGEGGRVLGIMRESTENRASVLATEAMGGLHFGGMAGNEILTESEKMAKEHKEFRVKRGGI